VANIKKHAPTIEYQLSQLDKISDEIFCENLSSIVNDVWIKQTSLEQVVEKFNISQEQIQCFIDIFRYLINALSRGTTTKEIIREEYKGKLSVKKLDNLINQISVYHKHWNDTVMFSNVQDIFFNMSTIFQQNNAILKQLKEITNILNDMRKSKTT
jgi:hypothetical protein